MALTKDIRLRLTQDIKEQFWARKERMRKDLDLKILCWEMYFMKSCGVKIR